MVRQIGTPQMVRAEQEAAAGAAGSQPVAFSRKGIGE